MSCPSYSLRVSKNGVKGPKTDISGWVRMAASKFDRKSEHLWEPPKPILRDLWLLHGQRLIKRPVRKPAEWPSSLHPLYLALQNKRVLVHLHLFFRSPCIVARSLSQCIDPVSIESQYKVAWTSMALVQVLTSNSTPSLLPCMLLLLADSLSISAWDIYELRKFQLPPLLCY